MTNQKVNPQEPIQTKEPCFAGYNRPADWFEIGDEVVCSIFKDFENVLKKDVFVTGKVIDGHRYGDGCVSVCAGR